ncbi:transglycosylase SLT domain-containing protein [Pseudomonas sp. P9_31]|uniref:transglycosylase SLT domain-containing protein n=1 Tax=Pseudomonas sp. P9_31 TaxID=3043448 RepID=UPI002A358426|nr:transglycosylase SLT domain-containing protein [Pseudomonas sp. P9_31]WPN56847.1 transglycosylase SLT domain-containing protein [Pseudomonas sp. P9_31]
MTTEKDYASVKAKGTPYDSLIRQEADRNNIPYDFMHKLIFNESSFNPIAKSPTGPLGLGQMTELTGKAYGLMSPEDRMDPAKAIPAVARHLKDLSGAYKGDLLKTALAYNQGQGRLGSSQLSALDSGDFSKISPEGQNYMRKLLDVSGDSPSRQWFDAQEVTNPGINPKAQAVTFEDATQGVAATPKVRVGENLPQLGNMNLDGGTAPQTQQDYITLSAHIGKPEKGTFEGTGDATAASLATSPVASIFRYATQEDHDPLDWVNPTDNSQWTAEDYDMIRKEGVDPQYFSFVQDYAKGKRANLPNAIAMAKENMEYERRINGAGTGAQIVGGFAGAGLDPLTYVPVPGTTGARLISRVAQGAMYSGAAAVASEGLRESMTGIEGHYGTALVGGALFGAGATALFDRALQAAPKAAARSEVTDGDLEAILARHGESALPNERFDLHPDMEPDANDFAGSSIRLEARETARQLGQEDPSRFPWMAGEEPKEAFGVSYVDHPNEPGAVRLQDGSILSATNPLNPKLLAEAAEVMPDRAAKGVSMGGFTEIGYTLNRSESPDVLAIGSQLFRSPTGTVTGSNGKFGATASDIIERIQGQDHVTYNKMSEEVLEAIKDPSYAMTEGGRQAHIERAYRRVAEAIEEMSGNKLTQLTAGERKLMDTIKSHYDLKGDYLAAPAQFGNRKARPVLPETRHAGSYIPNIYSSAAKNLHLQKFGGQDGLQDAIKESWLASYAARPHVKSRVDNYLKDAVEEELKARMPKPGGKKPAAPVDAVKLREEILDELVEDYATRKAFGVAKSEDFDESNLLSLSDQGSIPGSMGLASNNFLEGRHLFDSDMTVPLSDGSQFAVNDLREFDLSRITPSYDRRVNGDIGIMGATGRTTGELLHDITKVKTSVASERKALEESVKILTGRARRDPEGALATASRALTDMSFFAKNAYMGVQSITEVAGMVTKGHTRMLLKGVPILKDMTAWGSKIKANDLADMHLMVFGRELDNHIRPTRQDIIQRLRDHANTNPTLAQVVGTIRYGTQEAAAWSPFTKFLTESSNYIADAGRQGVLSDFVNHVVGGRSSKLFEPERLKSMSITPEQFEGMKDLIATYVKKQSDGSYKVSDRAAFQRDPRTMDLWRMGDKIADETILRTHKFSSTDTEAYGAGVKMAMQFKNFTMRSVNSRLIRGYHDATKNGRAIDQTMQAVLSTGLAVSGYVAMKYSQASGMPKDQREKFLQQALDPNMLAYAALSRSSHIGAPLGLMNIIAAPLGFDQAAMVRSSILPRGPKEQRPQGAMKYSATKDDRTTAVLGRVAEQVPAYGVLSSVGQVGYNAFGASGTDSRRADQEYMTGVFNGLRGLVPNDPVSQKLLLMMLEGQGVEIR